MRRIPALISSAAVVTVLATALTGCTADGLAACTPTLPSGSASELVSATGKVGSKPALSVPTPLYGDAMERTVLVEGTGAPAATGATVDFEATVLDGVSGATLVQTRYDGSPAVRGVAGRLGALFQALECARVGDRIAITTPAVDAGIDLTAAGITDPESTIVFVIDVVASYLGKADGVNELPQDPRLPAVVTAPDGTPGITVPKIAAPEETIIATIKSGGGEAVADGDDVVINLSGWAWPAEGESASTFMTTWGRQPATQPISLDPTAAEGVPAGIHEALVGARVGSQVILVMAPGDSFAEGSWPTGTRSTDTLIYVIDVLGIQK